MSEFRRTSPDETYFITLTVTGWIDVFTRAVYKDFLIENLAYCQKKEHLDIFAYVLMSNHLHLVARRPEKDLTELLGRFKSYTAKKVLAAIEAHPQESRKEWLLHQFQFYARQKEQYSQYHFWQTTHHPVLLHTPALLQQKVDYIHQNPVKASIVTEPEYYVYSSACPDSPLKVADL
ncbi:transposase [Nibribacter ruber]|uniref:Transposase n=1 Tax=Nibribacter ruber TaxID=2698458 RepID=A0A6P1P4J4_9BACT|nr:transposase [Nibribacter ruber]QHL89248.1 transposase [Nibribacter ruber]